MRQLRTAYYSAWAARSRAFYDWQCGIGSEFAYRAADREYRNAGNEYVQAIHNRRAK